MDVLQHVPFSWRVLYLQDAILDVVTSGQVAWDGLQQRVGEPFKSLGSKCLVFGNGDDDEEVHTAACRGRICSCVT